MKTRHVVAGLVTVLGVVAIWWVASQRQEQQARDLSQQWIGEQWDIARRCVAGTPGPRGEDEEVLSDRLAAMAVRTLAEASSSHVPPDTARAWPARCLPLLSRLDADRSVTRGDVSAPLGELRALLPRTLEHGDTGRSMANARELAGPLRALDAAMPRGAEYDLSNFEVSVVDVAAIAASFECDAEIPPPPPLPDAPDDACPALVAEGGDLFFAQGSARTPVRPRPPSATAVSWACRDGEVVLGWAARTVMEHSQWTVIRCAGESCETLPLLVGSGRLAFVYSGGSLHAVAHGRWTDLPIARTLGDDAWEGALPIAVGAVEGIDGGIAVTACGERWTFAMEPRQEP